MDRRQIAEENYRQKFDALGLNERFEFIGREWSADHDKRFWSRCKTCGAEFLSWNEVLRGRQNRLICPECGAASDGVDLWTRSPVCDEAMAFYTAGHSVKETAAKFILSTYQINSMVKRRGLTNNRGFRTAANAGQRAKAEQRIINLLNSKGFDYLGGYTKKDCIVRIRCQRCGAVYERATNSIKHENIICRECRKAETRKRQEQRKQEQKVKAKAKAEQQQKEKEEARQQREHQLQLKRDQKLDAVFVCKVCGKEYTPRQYMDTMHLTLFSNPGYCSYECKRKFENRLGKEWKKKRGVSENHRHRAKKYGCEYDPSVTLKRLIERDGLRCAICGEMCDPNDTSWSEFSGPLSPSMDHIIPMAKGGGHIWSNVQVAHLLCNSLKSDHLD